VAKRKKSKDTNNVPSSEHTIPWLISPEVLKNAVDKRSIHKEQDIQSRSRCSHTMALEMIMDGMLPEPVFEE
jgi:hypothetical protein